MSNKLPESSESRIATEKKHDRVVHAISSSRHATRERWPPGFGSVWVRVTTVRAIQLGQGREASGVGRFESENEDMTAQLDPLGLKGRGGHGKSQSLDEAPWHTSQVISQ